MYYYMWLYCAFYNFLEVAVFLLSQDVVMSQVHRAGQPFVDNHYRGCLTL